MKINDKTPLSDNPCLFASEPLDRASARRSDPGWVASELAKDTSVLIPLYRGDPLMSDDGPVFLSAAAQSEFHQSATTVFLGQEGQTAYFAIDASDAPAPEAAPFADIGSYMPLRDAAAKLAERDLSMIGQGRWFLDWHFRHRHCARCGAETLVADGGAKRHCETCGAEHFPRSNPVAIVLAIHEDACLLGRSPHFPPGFLSALAGYVEAAETPEECAIRELREEAGVNLDNVRYQFSQPWPFTSSLMMGFFADAASRDLSLDETEVIEAKWIARNDVAALVKGESHDDVRLPPRFTIARQLIERWVSAP
ncbi:MAG: NAD(+) diphosphatase [Pseudomonadota bacterium]